MVPQSESFVTLKIWNGNLNLHIYLCYSCHSSDSCDSSDRSDSSDSSNSSDRSDNSDSSDQIFSSNMIFHLKKIST